MKLHCRRGGLHAAAYLVKSPVHARLLGQPRRSSLRRACALRNEPRHASVSPTQMQTLISTYIMADFDWYGTCAAVHAVCTHTWLSIAAANRDRYFQPAGLSTIESHCATDMLFLLLYTSVAIAGCALFPSALGMSPVGGNLGRHHETLNPYFFHFGSHDCANTASLFGGQSNIVFIQSPPFCRPGTVSLLLRGRLLTVSPSLRFLWRPTATMASG